MSGFDDLKDLWAWVAALPPAERQILMKQPPIEGVFIGFGEPAPDAASRPDVSAITRDIARSSR